MRTLCHLLALALLALCHACEVQPERPFRAEFEGAAIWQSRNDVAVPNDTGSRIDLLDLTGTGPEFGARLAFDYNPGADHGLRAVAAPLTINGTGNLDQPVSFQGQNFAAGETNAKYKFNTYRLTYRYRYYNEGPWQLHVGATGLIRDAEIKLEQPGVSASETNVGFVPLLHLEASYRFDEHWHAGAEFDGLAGGPGRLLELALRVNYDIDDQWTVTGGYRTLEGGADTDSVYAFGWLHFGLLAVSYRF